MSEQIDITLALLYSIFSGVVLVSNSIVVVVVVKSRQLHMPTLWNIAFMAAWDCALGLYFLVLVVPSKIINAFAYSEKLTVPASILLTLLIDQNILNIVVALVDRYISICWPLRYPILMSSRRFVLAVASVFSINVTRVLFAALTNNKVEYNPLIGVCIQNNNYAKFSSFTLISAAGSIIVFLLVSVLVKLWRIRRKSFSRNSINSTQFTLTICLSTIVYIACFLPFLVAVAIKVAFGEELFPNILLKIATTCILSNSLWNVYIYTFSYKPFKDAFLRVFFPSISRERKRRIVQLEFKQHRNQAFNAESSL